MTGKSEVHVLYLNDTVQYSYTKGKDFAEVLNKQHFWKNMQTNPSVIHLKPYPIVLTLSPIY